MHTAESQPRAVTSTLQFHMHRPQQTDTSTGPTTVTVGDRVHVACSIARLRDTLSDRLLGDAAAAPLLDNRRHDLFERLSKLAPDKFNIVLNDYIGQLDGPLVVWPGGYPGCLPLVEH